MDNFKLIWLYVWWILAIGFYIQETIDLTLVNHSFVGLLWDKQFLTPKSQLTLCLFPGVDPGLLDGTLPHLFWAGSIKIHRKQKNYTIEI